MAMATFISDTEGLQPARQSKHRRIYEGMQRIDEAINRLQDLKFRVQDDGAAPPTEVAQDPPPPSLLNVLEMASNGLFDCADRIDRLVSEIQEQLF